MEQKLEFLTAEEMQTFRFIPGFATFRFLFVVVIRGKQPVASRRVASR